MTKAQQRTPRSFCPNLESLEDRNQPATWTPLSNLGGGGEMMLLTDGRVFAEGLDNGSVSKRFSTLTPSSTGSYAAGTWAATAPASLERLYFGSNVLPDGRVFVLGGEYTGPARIATFTNTGEIYDPTTNTWAGIPNFPQSKFGDDPTMLLNNGKILAGYILGPQSYLYDPAANSWSATGNKLRNDRSDEETFVALPDGSILAYELFSGFTHAQRYSPSTETWTDAGTVPVALSSSSLGFEVGPAILLPDSRVFQVGANNHTAIYTPGTNSWVAGPDIPGSAGISYGADDAPGAILPNGHVLFTANNTLNNTSPFNAPTHMFEFDPLAAGGAGTITDIQATLPAALQSSLNGFDSFVDRMLMLPNGHMLFSSGNNQLWDLTPDGGPQTAWRPVVYGVTPNGGTSFHMTGTQLNGISAGASYGDDAEMDENYPIVSMRSLTGTVYYTKTTNWAPGVVQSGSTVLGTDFQVPSNVPTGTYFLTVSGAGIASTPIFFRYTAPALAASVALNSPLPSVSVDPNSSPSVAPEAFTIPPPTVKIDTELSNVTFLPSVAPLAFTMLPPTVTIDTGSSNAALFTRTNSNFQPADSVSGIANGAISSPVRDNTTSDSRNARSSITVLAVKQASTQPLGDNFTTLDEEL